MLNHNERVPRPVRPSDFVVVGAGLLLNIVKSIETFCEDIYELSIYHSNRKTKTNAAWEDMTQDLETLEEETDGR